MNWALWTLLWSDKMFLKLSVYFTCGLQQVLFFFAQLASWKAPNSLCFQFWCLPFFYVGSWKWVTRSPQTVWIRILGCWRKGKGPVAHRDPRLDDCDLVDWESTQTSFKESCYINVVKHNKSCKPSLKTFTATFLLSKTNRFSSFRTFYYLVFWQAFN